MAGGAVSGGSAASDTYAEARQWLLVPSWLVLGIFVLAPVCVMVIYSFLTKEFRGGVIWDPTLAAYDQFFFDRGLFGDGDPKLQWTYISIFWRSIWQAGLATRRKAEERAAEANLPNAWLATASRRHPATNRQKNGVTHKTREGMDDDSTV